MFWSYSNDAYESESDEDEVASDYACPIDKLTFEEQIHDHLRLLRRRGDRRLKAHGKTQSVKKQMDRVYTRNTVLFCIDVEAWEHNNEYVTEIGVSIYDPRHQELALMPNIKSYHIIIEEHSHLTNGKHVPDHSTNFSGGTTHILSLYLAELFMESLFWKYFGDDSSLPCALVGHNVDGDIRWLQNMGVSVPTNVRKLDTQTMFSHTHGIEGASLKNALRTMNQPHAFLHNAGNDAYFTLLLAMKLCDPNVRHLTKMEYLKAHESYREPVQYKKYPVNESILRRNAYAELIREAVDQ